MNAKEHLRLREHSLINPGVVRTAWKLLSIAHHNRVHLDYMLKVETIFNAKNHAVGIKDNNNKKTSIFFKSPLSESLYPNSYCTVTLCEEPPVRYDSEGNEYKVGPRVTIQTPTRDGVGRLYQLEPGKPSGLTHKQEIAILRSIGYLAVRR